MSIEAFGKMDAFQQVCEEKSHMKIHLKRTMCHMQMLHMMRLRWKHCFPRQQPHYTKGVQ
jgi:hypothetical protein